MTSSVLLKTSKIIPLPPESVEQRHNPLLTCTLKWRQGKLWVKQEDGSSVLPALESEQWLSDCLKKSSVRQVCLAPSIGEAGLKIWASACQKANKQVILRIPSHQKKFGQDSLGWRFKRLMDLSLAALLLIGLSPALLGVALLVKSSSPGSIFSRQWRVGKRGKLFQIFKFRTMVADAEKRHDEVMGSQLGLHKREDDPRITAVGQWLRRYSVDELPQLFNVLRGEMSLVGPRPWALYDALRLGSAGKQRLNALPGMTGAWQVQASSKLLEIDAVTQCDLDYLRRWSLGQDLIILLMTIPRVISGFGAH